MAKRSIRKARAGHRPWSVQYAEKIAGGEITVSRHVRMVYERLMREMADEGSLYWFDPAAGDRPVRFIETFCRQAEGQIGAPIRLGLWQKAFIETLFGWKRRADDLRRFTEAMLEVGRKNGKTTLLAGIGLYMLLADGEGAAEIYSVATKRDQAAKVFKAACNMRAQSPEIAALTKKRRSDLYMPDTFSYFTPLGANADTLDGLNSHLVIVDEMHAIRGRQLYDVMKESQSSRRQPLMLEITTNGFERESIFDDQYAYAVAVIEGKTPEPVDDFLALLYELDERDEWLDEAMWVKANPGLGDIKRLDKLQELAKRAKAQPRFLPSLLCKEFNLKSASEKSWLPWEWIDNGLTFDRELVRDTYAIGGCDLSSTTDLTCATLLIRRPDDPTVYVLQQYFLPEERVHEVEGRSFEAPYAAWRDRGLLTVCPGGMVDYHMVTQWFIDICAELEINPLWICYDRALSGYWVPEMEAAGFEMERTPQGPITWSQPMKEMGAHFQERRVNYNCNPILRWCLANTQEKSLNSKGIQTIQPVKIDDNRRIDGMVSLLNAWVGYVKHYDEYMDLVA
ncbi:MAG: terminase large subunit [Oscillospiraceae bacterium]|nr:terminase large subunit [Oscillospiraceae bacterium]